MFHGDKFVARRSAQAGVQERTRPSKSIAQLVDPFILGAERGYVCRFWRFARVLRGASAMPSRPGFNLKDYQSVIIWCERFGVLISPAV
jgi:hypothetical protein